MSSIAAQEQSLRSRQILKAVARGQKELGLNQLLKDIGYRAIEGASAYEDDSDSLPRLGYAIDYEVLIRIINRWGSNSSDPVVLTARRAGVEDYEHPRIKMRGVDARITSVSWDSKLEQFMLTVLVGDHEVTKTIAQLRVLLGADGEGLKPGKRAWWLPPMRRTFLQKIFMKLRT